MTTAANFFAAFEACLPAAYEVSCRIRTGSPTSFWLDSPRTVASRRSIGSPVPRRRGLGRQAATRRRHGGVYEFRRRCQSPPWGLRPGRVLEVHRILPSLEVTAPEESVRFEDLDDRR